MIAFKIVKCVLKLRIKKVCHLDEKYVVHIYNGILFSHKKKNEITPFTATWMDLEIIILSEVSQKEKDKYHMISLTCGI